MTGLRQAIDRPIRTTSQANMAVSYTVSVLAALLTLASLYYPPGSSFIISSLWRVAQLLLITVAILGASNTRSPKQFLAIFLPWLLAIAASTLLQFSSSEAWLAIARSLLLVFTGYLLTRFASTWHGEKMLLVFLYSIYIGSIIIFAVLLVQYGNLSSWSWSAARIAKAELLEINLQSNTGIFIIGCGLVLFWSRNTSINIASSFFFLALGFLLATRTPIVALILAFAASLVLQWASVRKQRAQSNGNKRLLDEHALLIALLLIGCITAQWMLSNVSDPAIARSLAGRVQLWQSGLAYWREATIIGDYEVDIAQALFTHADRLVLLYSWELKSLIDLESGGFHSVWVETLVRFGLIGFVGLFIAFFAMVRRLTFIPKAGFGASMIVIMLLLRSLFETSGLFASSNSPLDLFGMVLIALLLARSNRTEVGADTVKQSAKLRMEKRAMLRPA